MDPVSGLDTGDYGKPIDSPQRGGPLARCLHYLIEECTFFRVHLFAFIFVPLVFSGIFYACNGRFHVSFLDSLFLCYSAMTVTGLSTVNLSTLTAWQQVMLYILMLMGDITVVSWIMVLVRKRYFRTKCEYVASRPHLHRTRTAFIKSISSPITNSTPFRRRGGSVVQSPQAEKGLPAPNPDFQVIQPTPGATLIDLNPEGTSDVVTEDPVLSDARTFSSSPRAVSIALAPTIPPPTSPCGAEFAFTTSLPHSAQRYGRRLETIREGVPYPRRATTILSNRISGNPAIPASSASKKYEGFGGIPGPFHLVTLALKRATPNTYRKFERKATLPYITTLEERSTPWLDFTGLIVGRNSDFHTEGLTDEQVETIGGAEYRALRLLSYLVPIYFISTQLIAYILFGPWISTTHQYDNVFENQPRNVKKPWFALFQVMGAYTGGGLSLADAGMVPFQSAYLMVFALIFVILAGNHALVVLLFSSLRLVIWLCSRVVHPESNSHKALSFLLDHPRRCSTNSLFRFPSHQTWFLVICLVGFSVIEWVAFEVLNIGLDVFETLPRGVRIVSGLFQGLAARASGFSIVPIASLAPALQFLYVVMMYIASTILLLFLALDSSPRYEERSLGVFEAPPDGEDEEPADLAKLAPRERVGRYLHWHIRRQLSVDIWWLVWAVFLVAIIERANLLDEDKKWFDLFRVLFELVSAFGGIGLSLGFPSDNYSFVGAMRPLSKLVVIVIMVRGRHRGLPLAVDRAVLLPMELSDQRRQEQPGAPVVDSRSPPPLVVNTNGV
ncbi:cation transport protein-domain-containing protein [Infundibulicybe gibba]|nr:cation transport protein-domain-containing protein [Infundibulicybe gibba]